MQTSSDYTMLNSLFTPLAEGVLGAGTLSQSGNPGSMVIVNDFMTPGGFMAGFNNINSSYLPTGTQLYAWVFNSSSPITATEWGIFTASSGWFFPNDLGSETLNNMEIDTYVRGSSTGDISNSDRLMLVPLPDSQGAVLLLSAGLALHLRRARMIR
ncbi:MAG: hypothetical protein IPK32_06850 [Verrucomicrobiaceae bacterium]|nr:hypothetical protein [Verrucomicrobiaceae bacterium]